MRILPTVGGASLQPTIPVLGCPLHPAAREGLRLRASGKFHKHSKHFIPTRQHLNFIGLSCPEQVQVGRLTVTTQVKKIEKVISQIAPLPTWAANASDRH